MSAWPLLALLALPSFAVETPNDGWEPPNAAETACFAKLQRRFSAHAPGEPVDDVLKSLSEPVRILFDCRKAITIRTELKHWKAGSERNGWYEWRSGEQTREGPLRVESFVNVITFDAASLGEERSRRGRVDNTALYYHELLHGQLLIKAMKGDAKWKKAYCDSDAFDMGPADLGDPHQSIPALEDAYRDGLWNSVKDLKIWD